MAPEALHGKSPLQLYRVAVEKHVSKYKGKGVPVHAMTAWGR